ncbi:predicted protein [Nematostella vectensis]|uniref:F-box/LRR-repeat protein 15-like leucin rich repeat domain-containing protein n=1 Tax=Nematostella vectensis TaxID=45351 RepID=A7RUH1_NEMVE|nr:predicted protein [Nematostella vectensis]|eukprot:XP_001636915.1 predicted protein [Nematostella vectensis]
MAEKTEAILFSLPRLDITFKYILPRLYYDELYKCRRVCKSFKELCDEYFRTLTTFDIRNLTIRIRKKSGSWAIRALTARNTSLHGLLLPDMMTIKGRGSVINDIVSRNPLLETVDLSSNVFDNRETANSEEYDTILTKLADNCPRLKNLVLPPNVLRKNEPLCAIFKGCLELRVLNLNYAKYLSLTTSELALEVLAENCKRLRQLKLAGWRGIPAEKLSEVFQANPGLELVDLSDSCVTDSHISSLGKFCKALKSISLSENPAVSQVGFMNLFEGCFQLQSLDLSWTGIDSKSLTHLAVNCRKLTEVRLWSCNLLTEKGLCHFFSYCPTLKSIELTDLTSVSDESIVCLAKCCPNIKNLLLYNCDGVTILGFQEFFKQSAQLESVDISHRQMDDVLVCLAENCTKLKNLTVDYGSQQSTQGLKNILKKCPDLQSLALLDFVWDNTCFEPLITQGKSKIKALNFQVSHASWPISLQTFKDILLCCQDLKKISISKMENLCDEWISWLAETFPRLKHVELKQCPAVSVKSEEILIEKCPEVFVEIIHMTLRK